MLAKGMQLAVLGNLLVFAETTLSLKPSEALLMVQWLCQYGLL